VVSDGIEPTRATRKLEWDSAHRVLRHESKCATLHGHRYVAEVTCEALELDDCGRVADFGVIKQKVGAWIDEFWDHTTLVNEQDSALLTWCRHQEESKGNRAPYVFKGEPTAENIAAELFAVAKDLLATDRVRLVHVRVYETPNCWCDVGVLRG